MLEAAPAQRQVGRALAAMTADGAIQPGPHLREAVVAAIGRLSAGKRLCVLGNWFAGLSIEDCVDRSRREWERVAALAG